MQQELERIKEPELKLMPVRKAISGKKFLIPKYQRGYRWTKRHIEQLLNDISAENFENYCLQPLVVVENEDSVYEVIDGQQRLTTIYILYKYIKKFLYIYTYKTNEIPPIPSEFSISYQTRNKSQEFLENIDLKENTENIDYYYMSQAYKHIDSWFNKTAKKMCENGEFDNENDAKAKLCNNIDAAFDHTKNSNAKINFIWCCYNESDNTDSMQTFKNLNRGKILLSNSELIKAMLIMNAKSEAIRHEISNSWYLMEKELQDDSFWYFLTNYPKDRKEKNKYQTRIDLVLDLIANPKNEYSNDDEEEEIPRSTFLDLYDRYLNNKKSDTQNDEAENKDLWGEIKDVFLTLKSWYQDRELYHKIGYLIASETSKLSDIYLLFKNEAKSNSDFKNNKLEELIKKSVNKKIIIKDDNSIDENKLKELKYEDDKGNQEDYNQITSILLLHNVKTIHFMPTKERFPFDKYKIKKGNKNKWTLEHIDAQNSEGLQKNHEREEWVNSHEKQLKNMENDIKEKNKEDEYTKITGKINEFRTAFENKKDLSEIFNDLQLKINGLIDYLTGVSSDKHTIDNLALLNGEDNSALNKSRFGVKRSKIVTMDKNGCYIPACTRNVFLKYYTLQEENSDIIPNLIYWDKQDREKYFGNIVDTLKKSWEDVDADKEKENK